MPAVLSGRRPKLAAALSVVVGALALGGASSAQAAPIPCEWYDCNWQVEVEFPKIPPECRCPDIYRNFSDYVTLPELQIDRSRIYDKVALGSELTTSPGLDLNVALDTAGFGR